MNYWSCERVGRRAAFLSSVARSWRIRGQAAEPGCDGDRRYEMQGEVCQGVGYPHGIRRLAMSSVPRTRRHTDQAPERRKLPRHASQGRPRKGEGGHIRTTPVHTFGKGRQPGSRLSGERAHATHLPLFSCCSCSCCNYYYYSAAPLLLAYLRRLCRPPRPTLKR